MFLNYAKTKAMDFLDNEKGSSSVEYAAIVAAMFVVVLPSIAYYSSKIQKLFMVIADLWKR